MFAYTANARQPPVIEFPTPTSTQRENVVNYYIIVCSLLFLDDLTQKLISETLELVYRDLF